MRVEQGLEAIDPRKAQNKPESLHTRRTLLGEPPQSLEHPRFREGTVDTVNYKLPGESFNKLTSIV